ncbi:MAG: hypothetical protein QOI81_2416 [Actinomycetota bacterium]|nr:hypothetical protein [Actinomycetota bacterium]
MIPVGELEEEVPPLSNGPAAAICVGSVDVAGLGFGEWCRGDGEWVCGVCVACGLALAASVADECGLGLVSLPPPPDPLPPPPGE